MKRLRWIVRLTVLCLAVWGIGFEPGWLQQRQLTLSAPGWPGPPLAIAVASDLHVGSLHAGLPMLHRVVDELNASHPDLILLLGDFMILNPPGGETVEPSAIARVLARLKAPLGVYATLGNHDWGYDGEQVRQALQNVGITVLENSAIALPTDAGPLWLAGIGDDMTSHARPDRAFAQVPAAAPLIVMMHDPANAPDLPARALVAFAGHTHGGQVRLPFIGALFTPGRSPLRHAYGWIPDVPAPTFVTTGVGTSIFPIRFNSPPEIVILRLSGQTSS